VDNDTPEKKRIMGTRRPSMRLAKKRSRPAESGSAEADEKGPSHIQRRYGKQRGAASSVRGA